MSLEHILNMSLPLWCLVAGLLYAVQMKNLEKH